MIFSHRQALSLPARLQFCHYLKRFTTVREYEVRIFVDVLRRGIILMKAEGNVEMDYWYNKI